MKEIIDIIPEIALGIQKITQTDFSSNDLGTGVNKSGDDQVPLDVISDDFIFNIFKGLDCIYKVVSEERENIDIINPDGEYSIAYDPLDGSSLVDVNLSVGTIFGIYKGELESKNLVGAAYIIYGPRLEIVYSMGENVKYFQNLGGIFVEKKIGNLKDKGKIVSPGGLKNRWKDYHSNLISELYDEEYTLRYSGAMIVELHHILLKGGGLHSYPELDGKPDGKLRKLFEVFPLAFIYEKLGGFGIDKNGTRLLDLDCKSIHEATSCYFGTKYEIEKVKKHLPSFSH
ncbi:fructose-1,6-bisphosphatase [Candidatus Gracilibacteria bacterium]|nr:fructose-1,6-bisphosphatase [Candidatus Gracilibacteria bacterium]